MRTIRAGRSGVQEDRGPRQRNNSRPYGCAQLTDETPNLRANVETYLARERRLRSITWAAALLPLAVFLALIYLTIQEKRNLQELRQQRLDLQNQQVSLQRQIDDSQATLDKMKTDIQYYASQLTPSIAISFANEGQRFKANELAGQLKKLGYEVTVDDEPKGVHISFRTYIRCFFQKDDSLARQLQEQLKSMGVNAELQSFAEIDEEDREALGYIRPKSVEFWLGRWYKPN